MAPGAENGWWVRRQRGRWNQGEFEGGGVASGRRLDAHLDALTEGDGTRG
jgi:hypothetical protein